MTIRKRYGGKLKGKIALEAVKEEKTIAELTSLYDVHPNQIRTWKSHLIKNAGEIFEDKRRKKDKDKDELINELYRQIGQLKVELDWLKKNLHSSVHDRVRLIDRENRAISLSRQAELLGVSRSAIYYKPLINKEDLLFRKLIDEIYTAYPFYGSRKIKHELGRRGHKVGRERVRKLMRSMGIEAIYPKRKTSQPHPDHKIYPYLLRGVKIDRVNQVWSTDITYIRMREGWLYLVAVMDWYSRYVLSWELSTTLETDFCIRALENALQLGKPEIFNTDQGSQFTSQDFTGVLLKNDIKISMDGRGRVFDNIFIERLWRSLKYEEVYIHDYETIRVARKGIHDYFDLYNNKRLHESLGYVPPVEFFKV